MPLQSRGFDLGVEEQKCTSEDALETKNPDKCRWAQRWRCRQREKKALNPSINLVRPKLHPSIADSNFAAAPHPRRPEFPGTAQEHRAARGMEEIPYRVIRPIMIMH